MSKYNFWCENRVNNPDCEFCNSKGDLVVDKKEDYACPNNTDIQLKLMGENTSVQVGEKMKHRPAKERRERSISSFREQDYDHLPKWEKKHFQKKLGVKP